MNDFLSHVRACLWLSVPYKCGYWIACRWRGYLFMLVSNGDGVYMYSGVIIIHLIQHTKNSNLVKVNIYTCMEWELKSLCYFPDVAYQDVLNEFDSTWGVKGLMMIRSNLIVTWKDRPHMSIISWFPLGLRWFACVGCILGSFNLCQKKSLCYLSKWMLFINLFFH